MAHLPDPDVRRWVGKGPFEHSAHLEGVRVNLGDVVQHHEHSSQGVDAGEQTDVTKQQEQLQVVIKCALERQKEAQAETDIRTHTNTRRQLEPLFLIRRHIAIHETLSFPLPYQLIAHICLQCGGNKKNTTIT